MELTVLTDDVVRRSMRVVELDRLDKASRVLTGMIAAGENTVRATEALTKVLERRSRILGLLKP